jgi:aspartate/tyrosine/aromatic aminotransferase
VLSQLKRVARAMYSNPPVHGARIVAEVVNDEAMFEEWKAEMAMMSGRIMSVRGMLYDALTRINTDRDWSFVQQQIGMFSYTGALLPTRCLAVLLRERVCWVAYLFLCFCFYVCGPRPTMQLPCCCTLLYFSRAAAHF